MEYFDLIQKRYSVRAYKPRKISKDKLKKIFAAARLAPTASNRQPFRLIVAKTAGKQEELRQIYSRDWFVQAPLVICGCTVASEGWVRKDGRSYLDVDIAIVMDHLILAAANLGLGTCWIANFDSQAARGFFKLPEGVDPIILTPLGYPADHIRKKERKRLNQIIFYEAWSGTI